MIYAVDEIIAILPRFPQAGCGNLGKCAKEGEVEPLETKHSTQEQTLEIIRRHGAKQDKLHAILLDIQDASGQNYIGKEAAAAVAQALGMSRAKIYEVLTFYSMLHTTPQAKYIIEVCSSTPCYFTKSKVIVDALEKELSVKEGQATKDGLFIFYRVQCFGACDVGPAVKVNHQVYGPLDTEEKVAALLQQLRGKA